MVALSNLHIMHTMSTIDPLVDNVSFHLDYFTTYTTQDISDVADLCTKIHTVLNTAPGGGSNPMTTYISPIISRGAGKGLFEVYDVTGHLNGTPHGSPVLIGSWTVGGSGSVTKTPEGCCMAITLQAPYGSDVEFGPGTRPRARDRGKIYWGPLSLQAVDNDVSTNRCKLTTLAMTDVTKSIQQLNVLTSSPHTIVWNLAVWSRKNAAMKSLQECWIDDRPDYQRRRTDQSATRVVQGLP